MTQETPEIYIYPAAAYEGTNSGDIVFKGTINTSINITVTCTVSTITGITPATGLGPVNITPSFTDCTDNLGGKDTITPHRQWTLTFIDLADDEGLVIGATTDEPLLATGHPGHAGDQIQVTIPKGGATFMSTASNCVITAAPASLQVLAALTTT